MFNVCFLHRCPRITPETHSQRIDSNNPLTTLTNARGGCEFFKPHTAFAVIKSLPLQVFLFAVYPVILLAIDSEKFTLTRKILCLRASEASVQFHFEDKNTSFSFSTEILG